MVSALMPQLRTMAKDINDGRGGGRPPAEFNKDLAIAEVQRLHATNAKWGKPLSSPHYIEQDGKGWECLTRTDKREVRGSTPRRPINKLARLQRAFFMSVPTLRAHSRETVIRWE